MRIAMISYHTCPLATLGGKDTGGMNVYVRELTSHLGRLGIRVDVFTRSQDEHVPHILHDLGYGNRVVHIPAGPENPLPKADLAQHLPDFVQGIRHFAESKGIHYDLVHSHYWLSGQAAIALKDVWGTPFIQMFHTLAKIKSRIARGPDEMEGAYRTDGELQVAAQADRIIAATSVERDALTRLYFADPERIRIIPPGVELSHFYPIPADEARAVIGLPETARMLLFVGRIEPLKGIDTLLKAIALMRQDCLAEICPYYLAIIGGDPEETSESLDTEMVRLRKLCRKLGLDDMVVFLGKQDQAMLPYYYSAALSVVMPSFYESFGLVALESMACGTPVVASNTGGLSILVKDGLTGFTVPSGDVPALADRLTRLLADDELRAKIGQQAAAYARAYAWENIASQVLALYREILPD